MVSNLGVDIMKNGLVVLDFETLNNHARRHDFLLQGDTPIVRIDPKGMDRYSRLLKPQDRRPLQEVVSYLTKYYDKDCVPALFLGGSAVSSQLDMPLGNPGNPNYSDLDLLIVGSQVDSSGLDMHGLVKKLHKAGTEGEPLFSYGRGNGKVDINVSIEKAKRYMGLNLWERYDLNPSKQDAATIDLCVATYQSFLDHLKKF